MKVKKLKVGEHDRKEIENLIWFYDTFKKQKEEEKRFNEGRKIERYIANFRGDN